MESELSVKVSSQGARFELIFVFTKPVRTGTKILSFALIFSSFYAWLQGTHYILRLYFLLHLLITAYPINLLCAFCV